jgi:periplasmic protein CpxP/Spy
MAAVGMLAGYGVVQGADMVPTGQGQGGPARGAVKRGQMDAGERLERMSRHLDLTDEQKAKIKPILDDEDQRLKALRDDGSLTRVQQREKLRSIRQETHEKISPFLTPEQQKKIDDARAKALERQKAKPSKPAANPQ